MRTAHCRYKRYKASTATQIDVARHIAFCHDFQYEVGSISNQLMSASYLEANLGR